MTISENGVSFFGSGGHNHNGVNSTIIDVGSYSLFDFSLGFKGSQSRINTQSVNQSSLEEWVIRIVNSKVLQPAGLDLAPDILSGKSIRANTITAVQLQANTITASEIASNTITANQIATDTITANQIAANTITASEIAANTITASRIASNTITATQIAANTITATQIAANTITANEIAANTITSDELSSNIVLINNVIRSNNYSAGVSGWIISNTGSAEFNQITVRGNIFSTGGSIGGGTIDIGGSDSSSFHVDADGNLWLGSSAYTSAPFRVSAGGTLRSISTSGSNTHTTTLTNAAYRNEFYDAGVNAYALYTIGSTVLNHTGYFPGTGDLADTSIRERVVYQTDGIYMDGRQAVGQAYASGLLVAYVSRDTTKNYGRLTTRTKNAAGTETAYATLDDGNLYASGNIYGANKFFRIQHPTIEDRFLVHAAIEGPTTDVFYRGESALYQGEIEIELPSYFENLVKQENRTVFITPIVSEKSNNSFSLGVSEIINGKFKVFGLGESVDSNQKFYWRVEAERKDSNFEVEPIKNTFEDRNIRDERSL